MKKTSKFINGGAETTLCWGPDRSWMVLKPEYFKAQDYIEATLKLVEKEEPVFSGPISLYDRLTVDTVPTSLFGPRGG